MEFHNGNQALEEMRNGMFVKMWKTMFPRKPIRKMYSRKSLYGFGEAILKRHEEFPKERALLPFYGYYLGETAVKTIKGAEWEINEKSFLDSTIAIYTEGGSQVFNPFQQVHKFLYVKPLYFQHTLETFEYCAQNEEKLKTLPKNEWFTLPNGNRIRPHTMGL